MGLLLSPDHTATLTDPLTWKDNPFVARDVRRDIKKHQPFVAFCWMCGILLLVAPWTAWVLWAGQTAKTAVPLFIGGDIGTALCIVVSGVHIWFIVGTSRKHTTRQFTEESNQNTLASLLMLPISPFQILVQMTAYPWMAAMRLAAALLPVYVLCVGLDGPSWLELASLYLVFAMAAFSVPFWTRPALSENVAILAPPKQAGFGPGAKQTGVSQGTAARSASASGVLALRLFLIPIVLSWIVTWKLGGMSAFDEGLHKYLPSSITNLFVSIPVSWPLILARLFITPLDWFGFSLIPLPFILLLFLLGKYSELVRASEFLSVGAYRDLPLQSTYLPRLRLMAGVRIATALIVMGYFWKLGVVNGALKFFGPPVLAGDPGLAGFAFLLVCFAAISACARGAMLGQWQAQPLIRGERQILCRSSLAASTRYLAEPFVFAVGFYLLCCLVAHTNPFPSIASVAAGNLGALFMRTVLIGFAGAVLSFGISRLFGPPAAILRAIIPGLIGLGTFYSESQDVRAWLASYPQIARALSFIPHLRSLQILSPFLGILHAGSTQHGVTQRMLPNAPSWQAWIATSLAVGGVLWLVGHLIGRRAHSTSLDAVTLVFDPTVLGREVFSDPVQLKRSAVGRVDTPFVLEVIARLQRLWDNAVVTRELRSRLRGQWEHSILWTLLALSLALSFMFFHPGIAPYPTFIGGWLAYLLMGPMHSPVSITASGILGCWYIALFVTAVCNAFVTTGAFYSETQKSTLGFLLATPMGTRAIVLGKALGVLGPSIAILAAISAWTLLLTVLFLPWVGGHALLGWFYAALTAFTLYLMVNAVTFSISALFPKLSMSGSAWVWVLLFWFGGGPLVWMYLILFATFLAMGLQGVSLWFAFIAIGWVLILIAYLISCSSIDAMRKRDLTFATSKRNN